MNSAYYEYLTNSAKADPTLSEENKETILAFLKRIDTKPVAGNIEPRVIAYLDKDSLDAADIPVETLTKHHVSVDEFLDEWAETIQNNTGVEDECREAAVDVLTSHGIAY